MAGPEVVVEDVLGQRLDEQLGGEFQQVQVCTLGRDDLEAHHFLAQEGPRVHRSAGHPKQIVDDVDS